MAEWLKAHAWKACLGETLTWVRIPLSPPVLLVCCICLLPILQSIPLSERMEARMAFTPVPKAPNVNLTKYVNLGENQWRFCPVVVSGNGRIKPDYVLAAGRPELHREGSYY